VPGDVQRRPGLHDDTLMSAGSCQATCTNTAITMPINNDGCLPAGRQRDQRQQLLGELRYGVREGNETATPRSPPA